MPVTPSLVYDDAPAAIDWLVAAFGFEEVFRVPGPHGVVLYAELRFGDDHLMLETAPDGDLRLVAPGRLDGRSHGVCVQVEGDGALDAHRRRAEAAGARIVRPLAGTDHGLQYSALDPEGHLWTFSTYRPGSPQ